MSADLLRIEELEFLHLVRDLSDDECSELYELRYHPAEPWCGPELNGRPGVWSVGSGSMEDWDPNEYPVLPRGKDPLVDEWPEDEADLPF